MADAVAKMVKVQLVKGCDYTVFGQTFVKGKAVEVTPEQAEYLLNKCDNFFGEAKPSKEEVGAKAKAEAEAKAKAEADSKAKAAAK